MSVTMAVLAAGLALGDAGPGAGVAQAPVSYALAGRWEGTGDRGAGVSGPVTFDEDRVDWRQGPCRAVVILGASIVLRADGTADLWAERGRWLCRGTYRWAGPRLRLRIPVAGETWVWDLERVRPGK
jgi:hypothetical protein